MLLRCVYPFLEVVLVGLMMLVVLFEYLLPAPGVSYLDIVAVFIVSCHDDYQHRQV